MTTTTATKTDVLMWALRYQRYLLEAMRFAAEAQKSAAEWGEELLQGYDTVPAMPQARLPHQITDGLTATGMALREALVDVLIAGNVEFVPGGTYDYRVDPLRHDLVEVSMGRITIPLQDLLANLEQILFLVEG